MVPIIRQKNVFCDICKTKIPAALTIWRYYYNVKEYQGEGQRNFFLTCRIHGCLSSFQMFARFKSHWYEKHHLKTPVTVHAGTFNNIDSLN